MLALVFDGDSDPIADDARIATRWLDDQGQTFATGLTAGHRRWIDWAGLGVFSFDVSSPTVRFAARPDVDRLGAAAHFSRVIQPLILQAQGWPVLHASAAAGPDGAVVFCGLSGSGKSTIAYAVADQPGFRQVADDVVVLRADGDGDFSLVPIAFRPRLRNAALAHFGLTRPAASPIDSAGPEVLPLRAVVVLAQRVDNAASPAPESPQRVSPTAAFSTLLTHAHCFDTADRGAVARMVETYLAMADSVPVFHLTYRPDFSTIDRLAQAVTRIVGRPQTT